MPLIKPTKKDRLTREEQLNFLDYLKNSLSNGFSLNASLELMPILWPKRKDLMVKLNEEMKLGAHFNEELLKLGFSKTTATQVNLAMQQGSLLECLDQLATLNRLRNEQIKKLKAELSYPFILAVMMVVLLLFMQTFISNQFEDSSDHSGDILLLGLIVLVVICTYYFAKILNLLAKQDYKSLLVARPVGLMPRLRSRS